MLTKIQFTDNQKPGPGGKSMKKKDTMSTAALEARRAYQREWNHKNPDKVKAAQARYWERKAANQAAPDPRE